MSQETAELELYITQVNKHLSESSVSSDVSVHRP